MNKHHLRHVSHETQLPTYQNSVTNIDSVRYPSDSSAEDIMERHSLEYIRLSLRQAQRNDLDLVSMLEQHQEFLMESIGIIASEKSGNETKQFHLSRLLHVLNMHGKAQEETLYTALIANDAADARTLGFAGRYETNLIFQLGYELYAMNFHAAWTEEVAAKACLLSELVSDLVQSNNDDIFEVAENRIEQDQLDLLANEYIKKCINYLDEELNAPPNLVLRAVLRYALKPKPIPCHLNRRRALPYGRARQGSTTLKTLESRRQ